MASTKAFLEAVLERLANPEITFRPMMGEYVIYYRGKVVGGIYDDRFLLKKTKSALAIANDLERPLATDIPYEGGKETLVPDLIDLETTRRLIEAIADDLPEPKKKRSSADRTSGNRKRL